MSTTSIRTARQLDAFVLTTVETAVDATPYDRTELIRAVSALADWSRRNGTPLECESVFARDNIVGHINDGLIRFGQATRTNRRSQLLRVAEAVLEPALAPRALPALAGSDPTAPYTDEEADVLVEWARKEKRRKRGDDAMVLLALGFGAGLSAQEVMNVRAGDVESTEIALLIHVREGRARTVPVLRRWEKVIAKRTATVASADYLFKPGRAGSGKNLISNFVADSRGSGVYAQTQRMRSTWLVTHMNARTPLPELIGAAGLDSLEALTRYLPFVARVESSYGHARLRGA
jgi:integrase